MRVLNGRLLACCGLLAVLAVLNGCDKHKNEEYVETSNGGGDRHYTTSSAPSDSVVKPVVIVDDATKGIKYAVLQQGAVITKNIDGWQGLSPALFAKLTGGIAVPVPEEDKMYHRGYNSMPLDIKSSEEHPERKATNIYANYLVPKEINGWVAVSTDTFEKLIKEHMTSK